jgi:hypothetical protein
MRPLSFRPKGNVGTWGVLRSFSILIVVPAISVSLASRSGSSWLVGDARILPYGTYTYAAQFVTASVSSFARHYAGAIPTQI